MDEIDRQYGSFSTDRQFCGIIHCFLYRCRLGYEPGPGNMLRQLCVQIYHCHIDHTFALFNSQFNREIFGPRGRRKDEEGSDGDEGWVMGNQ